MTENTYCDQCKGPIDQDQKYCERCGAQQPTVLKSSLSPDNIHHIKNIRPSEQATQGLLDPCRMIYVIEENFTQGGSCIIYTETGLQIGTLNRRLLAIRDQIEIRDLDNQVVTSIHRKLVAIRPTCTLKDENEQLLGYLEKTLLNLLHPKFYLKNTLGDILLTAQGKLMGFDFMIYSRDQIKPSNVVAKIHKIDPQDCNFISGDWNLKEIYGIQVLQPDIDRRLVLGFVIAIDNMIHD